MRKTAALLLIGLCLLWTRGWAQKEVRGSRFSVAWAGEDGRELKALFTGQSIRQVSRNQVLVDQFQMKSLRDGRPDQVQLVVEAPQCLFNTTNSEASSPGPLHVYSISNSFVTLGEGFLCVQGKSSQAPTTLVISNKVQTLISKELIKASRPGSNSRPSAVPFSQGPVGTNQMLKITSDRCRYVYSSNVVVFYSGNVRVDDQLNQLTCQRLTIVLATNTDPVTVAGPAAKTNSLSIRQMIAEEQVVITDPTRRATADHAEYVKENGQQTFRLTGRAHWEEKDRSIRAGLLVMQDKLLSAHTNAVVRFTSDALKKMAANKSNDPASLLSNAMVQIQAQEFHMPLPETNRPLEAVLARGGVVIDNPGFHATADLANYSQTNGLLVLDGQARMERQQMISAADRLTLGFNSSNLLAQGHAYFRRPLNERPQVAAGTARAPVQMLEIRSSDYEYNQGRAVFRTNVVARKLEGAQEKEILTCARLEIGFNEKNQPKSVRAIDSVRFRRLPFQPNLLRPELVRQTQAQSDLLEVNFFPTNDWPQSVVATGRVIATQQDVTGVAPPVESELNAGRVDLFFNAKTNQMQQAVARGKVFVQTGHSRGVGQLLTYTNHLGGEVVEMTGQPLVLTERENFGPKPKTSSEKKDLKVMVPILVTNAAVLRWYPKTNSYEAVGPYSIRSLPPTNQWEVYLPKPK